MIKSTTFRLVRLQQQLLLLLLLLVALQSGEAAELGQQEVGGSQLSNSETVLERCAAYETALREANSQPQSVGRDELLRSILESASGRDQATMKADDLQMLNDIRECLGATAQMATTTSRLALDRSHMFILSKSQQDSKALTLDQRCKLFDEKLREIMLAVNASLATSSRAKLFRGVIGELSSRQLPFGNSQPVLVALQECVSKLSEFQSEEVAERNVIAGPNPSVPIPQAQKPMERVQIEFKEVKNNVKDFGQDLYNKKAVDMELEQEFSGHTNHYEDNPSEANKELESAYDKLGQQFQAEATRARQLETELERARRVEGALMGQVGELQRKLAGTQEALREEQERRRRDADNLNHDDDNDDDDEEEDDEEDDDDDRELAKRSGRKDKKSMKKKKKEEDKCDDKVYKGPVDIARKLQDKMNSSESPENRCQKYYMALKYSGKVTKKFIKLLAKLDLPNTINQDPAYHESLKGYAQLLTKSSNKNSRLAASELEQCFASHSASLRRPFSSIARETQHEQRNHAGPQEISVFDMRSKDKRHFSPSPFKPSPPGKIPHHPTEAQEIPISFINSGKPRGFQNAWSYSHQTSGGLNFAPQFQSYN